MAYIRAHGNQLELVHGTRNPDTKQVEQQVLFTFYSKREALDAIGEGTSGADQSFRQLCEYEFSAIRFHWPSIQKRLRDQLHKLPDRGESDRQRAEAKFRAALFGFAKQLCLNDPWNDPEAKVILHRHRAMLDTLIELIENRCIRDDSGSELSSTPWSRRLKEGRVPHEVEEFACAYWEKRDLLKAEAAFSLLVGAFDSYAEGYNYLGLIVLENNRMEDAIAHFRRTVEVGRRLFPKGMAKKRYWSYLETRPYMRGLRNLAFCLNRKGDFDEALAICDRLDDECGDTLIADYFRAMILLNTDRYREALSKVETLIHFYPDASFMAAFALFSLGRKEEAVAHFLHAALNLPRAARILFGTKRLSKPEDNQEIEDHNAGVAMSDNLRRYFSRQPAPARRFFKSVLDSEQVRKLFAELQTAMQGRRSRSGDRADFDKMQELQSPEFANAQAKSLFASLH